MIALAPQRTHRSLPQANVPPPYPESEIYAAAALRAAHWLAWLTDALRRRERTLNALAIVATIAFYLWHFSVVWTNAVDVPYWDEWNYLNPDGMFVNGFSWRQALAQHNEHRIVFTKSLIWLQHCTIGWDVRVSLAINYGLYGGLLAVAAGCFKRWSPATPWWVVLVFTGFLQSTLNHENLSWGFQSQFHLTLAFFVAGAYFMFDPRDRYWTALAATACLWGSMFSMSSGVPAALAACGVFAASTTARLVWGAPERRRRVAWRGTLIAAGMTANLAMMLYGFATPAHHPAWAMPWKSAFVKHYLNLVAMSCGVETPSRLTGGVCLVVATAPLLLLAYKRRLRLDANQLAVAAAIGGILAILASVSLGRAPFGVEQAKSSRYVEYAGLLVPLAAAAWQQCRGANPVGARLGLLALWLLAVAGYANNWSMSPYHHIQQVRIRGVEHLQRHLVGYPSSTVPGLTGGPVAYHLEVARKNGIPFYSAIAPRPAPNWSELRPVAGGRAAMAPAALLAGFPAHSPIVEFTGWSADDVDPAHIRPGARSYLILSGPGGDVTFPCAPAHRPDVVKNFSHDGYAHSGVWAGIPAEKLSPGEYRVILRTVRDNEREYFEHVVDERCQLPPRSLAAKPPEATRK